MADQNHDNNAVHSGALTFACVLLALFAARHFGYYAFDGQDRAQAWNISGAVTSLLLAAAAFRTVPTKTVALIFAWIAFEEVQVIVCSAAWIIHPWTVQTGSDQCSSLVGLDIASLGMIAIVFLLWRLPVRVDSDGD